MLDIQKIFMSYTNNIFQKDGGTHLLGFRSALTRVINKYATEQNLLKKNKVSISGDDIKRRFNMQCYQ